MRLICRVAALGVLAGLAGAPALGAFAGLAGAPAAALELTACELSNSQGVSLVQARCGTLERPLDPDAPDDGRTVSLEVAVVDSFSPEPRPDAFTVINGGPGASSRTLYAEGAAAFSAILRERDIVIVDQRGTGESTPLACPELAALGAGIGVEEIGAATAACLNALETDPRFFTTSVAVRDLDAVREALGYEQLNIYGVSYGTRVALHYARRFPQRLRSLVIDGVVPPGLALGPNAALNAQRSFDRLLERCAADASCSSAYPELDTQFARLAAQLAAEPRALTLPDPVTGQPQELTLTATHLAVTVRLLSYAPETAGLIPVLIAEAEARGNLNPLATQALRILSDFEGLMRVGMHNAVVCTEDVPFLDAVSWAELEATYLGREQVDALKATCDLWPAGVLDDDLRTPLSSDIPTLILSGSEDPITPPAYGDEVAAGLSNSLHLVAEGQGHGVFARGCLPTLMTRFVELGSWEELDASCLDRLRPPPFFLDLLGPAP